MQQKKLSKRIFKFAVESEFNARKRIPWYLSVHIIIFTNSLSVQNVSKDADKYVLI